AQFRAFANERAGRPRETPVILIAFAWGAEIIPSVLNQTGPSDARGAVLIAPDKKGATRFRGGSQLKLYSPPGAGLDVEDLPRRPRRRPRRLRPRRTPSPAPLRPATDQLPGGRFLDPPGSAVLYLRCVQTQQTRPVGAKRLRRDC